MPHGPPALLGPLLGALLLALPGPAAANLLANPGFADDLSGWDRFGAEHSSLDAGGSGASGSALLGVFEQVWQCFPVAAGAAVAGSAAVFLPSGQGGQTRVFPNLQFFDTDDCTGLGFNQQLFFPLVPEDRWTVVPITAAATVPAGARSVRFVLQHLPVGPPVPGDLRVHFDDAVLVVPEPVPWLLLALSGAGLAGGRGARVPRRRRLP